MPSHDHAPGYVPNPLYSQDDWDVVADTPPLTGDELARARPGPNGMPDELAAAFRSRAGRPRSETRRVPVSLRIDREILETFKATGPGWQTRMHEVLAEAARKLKAA